MKYGRMSMNAELGSFWKGEVLIFLNGLRNSSRISHDDCASGIWSGYLMMQVRNKFQKSVWDYLEGSENVYDTNM